MGKHAEIRKIAKFYKKNVQLQLGAINYSMIMAKQDPHTQNYNKCALSNF